MSKIRAATVLGIFFRLGCTSFGGPIAHLGFFRAEFVARRRWLDEAEFADMVALCQSLPGPASSQVAASIGLVAAGLPGLFAAWLGFTLPSAAALILFAYGVGRVGSLATSPWLHGLKIVAVAVVAQALWGMARSLCPDRLRMTIAIAMAVLTLAVPSAPGQIAAIILGALIGWRWIREPPKPIAGTLSFSLPRALALTALVVFAALLAILPLAADASGSHIAALVSRFYRAGALVFGGGHVVLPLLQQAVVPPGWISNGGFLAGYGAAQAVPGPLFTFAAYLGAAMGPQPNGWLGGLICLISIYLPSFLLLIGVLPYWDGLRRAAAVQSASRGVNAAVVGLLLSALYDPVWTSAIDTRGDFAIGIAAFLLLVFWRAPPWLVVLLGAAAAELVASL
ncbi:MAG TPA: chromate efflux transporter [Acetobacteraceae bacterium]|nr:chromate efflux transporter [Acetobacteraceae bacterium]